MYSDFYMDNLFVIRNASSFKEEYSIYRKDVAFRAAHELSKEMNKLRAVLLQSTKDVLHCEWVEIVFLAFELERIIYDLEKDGVKLNVTEKNPGNKQNIEKEPEQNDDYEGISNDDYEEDSDDYIEDNDKHLEPKSKKDVNSSTAKKISPPWI